MPYPSSRGQDNLWLTSWQRLYNLSYVWRESEGVPRPVRLMITINTHTQYTAGPYNVQLMGSLRKRNMASESRWTGQPLRTSRWI